MSFVKYLVIALFVYLVVVSLVSAVVTAWDKRVSKIPGHRRVPEKTLITLALIGGSLAMYMTMLSVRHKTKHPKFMVGIPAIMILQTAIAVFVCNSLR